MVVVAAMNVTAIKGGNYWVVVEDVYMEIWRYVGMKIWRYEVYGDTEKCRYGDMEI